MIIVLILDVLITLLTAAYARYIYVPNTVQIFMPPGNQIYINSSQRLSVQYSSSDYNLSLVQTTPRLLENFGTFSTDRQLMCNDEANFGIFEGLHKLRITSSQNVILQIQLENNFFDNLFSIREVLFLARANETVEYNFTTRVEELPMLKIAIIDLENIANVRNYYYYCEDNVFCSYESFRKQVASFQSSQQTDIVLEDEFLNFGTVVQQEAVEGEIFRQGILITNGNEFNELAIKTQSPSRYQIEGLYDFITVLVGFYSVTLIIVLLHKYGIIYQEQY